MHYRNEKCLSELWRGTGAEAKTGEESMKLATAQTIPKDGNINANIDDHYRLTKDAANKGAKLILFPEMSLTGYTREDAEKLAFTPGDERLDALMRLAEQEDIVIVAGAPLLMTDNLHIATFILQPGKRPEVYVKQYLHSGEEFFFSASHDHNPVFKLADERFACAICADIEHTAHPEQAALQNTTCYLASLFYTPAGISSGHNKLSTYAKHYSMGVLVANFGGMSSNIDSGGKSGYWNEQGEIVKILEPKGEELLIIDK